MEFLMMLAIISPILLAPNSADWAYEHQLGGAQQVDTPLTFHQPGQSDIKLTARYDSKSFEIPPYWSIRTAGWNGDTAWEIELIHLKVYLTNAPSEVEYFSISHGHNLLFVNRAWRGSERVVWRVGGGVTISHPEAKVRGVKHEEVGGITGIGHFLTGVAVQAAGQYAFPLSDRFAIITEAKVMASYSVMPLTGGTADVPLLGIEGLAGLQIKF